MAVFEVNNSTNRFTLRLTLIEGAYNIANNTSSVAYKLELIANTTYNFENYAIGSNVIINGATVHNQARTTENQYSIADYGTLKLADGTATISHDADGSKTLSFSYSIDMAATSYTAGPLSSSGTMVLTQIPRQANLNDAQNFTDEQNPIITYSNPAGTAVEELMACISVDGNTANVGYRDISKTGTSYTFNLTANERNGLRNVCVNSNSINVIFFLRTKIGGAYYYSTLTRTLSIVNANPIFADNQVSYKDTNSVTVAITQNNQQIIQSKSTLTSTVGTATAQKGASITQYELTINGITKTSSTSGDVVFGTVNSANDVTLSVTAKDSRGNTTTISKAVTMLAWSPPTITATLTRVNNYEDETHLTINASISSLNSKNTMTVKYAYKESGGTYGTLITAANGTLNTITCDNTKSYVFKTTVTDKFTEVTKEMVLEKGKLPLFIDVEKNAVGINDFPMVGEALRVKGGAANFIDGVQINGSGIADFIVEQGISDIWTYRKWNSGISDCWGITSFAKTPLSAFGALYFFNADMPTFPTGLFSYVRSVSANVYALSGLYFTTTYSLSNTQAQFWAVSADNIQRDIYIQAHIIGRWK